MACAPCYSWLPGLPQRSAVRGACILKHQGTEQLAVPRSSGPAGPCRAVRCASYGGLTSCTDVQAYEGLETARTLREEYVFIPAKVRELYLAHMLETLEEQKIR